MPFRSVARALRTERPVSSGARLAFVSTMPATQPTPTMSGSPEDRRGLRRRLLVRIAILVVILGAASLVAWRLGYFTLLASGGLRRLMDRLHRVPWIGP